MAWEPDYLTLDDAKGYQRIGDTADDLEIALWITAASRAIDGFCGRQFGQVASLEARTCRPLYDPHRRRWVAELDDVQDITGLTVVDWNGNTITDYDLDPANAVAKGRPYERLLARTGPGGCGWWGRNYFVPNPDAKLTVTAKWGWTAVPTPVKAATFLQVARFAARRDSPFGVAGSPSDGSQVRLLAKLDPDVQVMLPVKYRRQWWAA
jgi:hypothetical protein